MTYEQEFMDEQEQIRNEQIQAERDQQMIDERKEAEALIQPKTVQEYVDSIVSKVDEGWLDALEAHVGLKRLKEVAEQADKKLESKAVEAFEGRENGTEIQNAKIEKRKTAGRWSFDHIPEITEREQAVKKLKEKAKEAYKAQQRGEEMYSTKNGVQVPAASYKEGNDKLFVKLLDK